jgi:hypothetical protein
VTLPELHAHVTLARAPGTAADREVLLGFPSDVDALMFADWWGQEGAALFAAYLQRSRFPLDPQSPAAR